MSFLRSERKPNLFIIGAAKSGTTALYHYLAQHPQIYMSPRKEPHFLAIEDGVFTSVGGYKNPMRTIRTHPLPVHREEEYTALFEEATTEKIVGEASPLYLYSRGTPERIARRYPDARIIAILRNPVDRAYSQFMHHVRDTFEWTRDFEKAFYGESERLKKGPFWHYRRMGYYHPQLKRYFDRLDRSRIKVFLFEDFISDIRGSMRDVFAFLDVDKDVPVDASEGRKNVTGVPRRNVLHQVLSLPWRYPVLRELVALVPKPIRRKFASMRQKNLEKPPLSKETRLRTIETYREDILQLQDLIERDLSHWLNVE